MATLFFRGDCQPRPQVTRVTPGTVEIGDTFTLTINRKDVSYTATVGTVDAVCRALAPHFGPASGIAEFAEITASYHFADEAATLVDWLILTGPDDGKPFTITSSTTEGGIALTIEQSVAGDPGTNEIQRITLPGAPTGGTFTLTFDGQTTGTIAYNAAAATVQTALEALSNIASGDVDVTGSAGGPWNIEFKSTYANQDVPILAGNGASLTYGAGSKPVNVTVVQQGVNGWDQVQQVQYTATSGTFTLSFDGQVTSAIAYNASASDVQTALEALSNIASGDVAVTKADLGSNLLSFNVTFSGAYRRTNAPLLIGDGASLDGGQSVSSVRVTAGSPTTNCKIQIDWTYLDGDYFGNPQFTLFDPITGRESNPIPIYSGSRTLDDLETHILGTMNDLLGDMTTRVTVRGVGAQSLSLEFMGPWAGKNFVFLPDSRATGEGQIRNMNGCTFTSIQEGSSTATNESQVVLIGNGPTGGTFTLTLSGQTTSAIAYNADAATVEAAIEALSNVTSVTVTGSAGGPWTVTFDGVDGGTPKSLFTGDATSLTGCSVAARVVTTANVGTNETQRITLGGSPAGGTFTLTFEGDTTSAIAFDAAASAVQTELEGLSTLGSGAVSASGSAGGPWAVQFTGTRGGENVPLITGSGASLTGGTVDVSAIQSATDFRNEVQVVSVVQAQGGTFTLTYSGQTTSPIAFNASAATVQTALEQLSSITVGKVVVSGSSGGPYFVEFIDTLGASDLALMTGSDSGLTGSGSQTLVVSQVTTPTGPNYWDDAENWSTGSLPADGDTVILENTDTDILYGLETLSGVTLAALHRRSSYTGKVGLPDFTGDYCEYRPRYLKIGVTELFIGEGSGSGGGRFRIDTQAVQTTIYQVDSGTPEDGSVPAVQHIGSNASNVLRLFRGSFGSAIGAGETSQFSAIQIGYRDDIKSDVEAVFGVGATLGTLDQTGGDVVVNSAIGATTSTGGTLTINGVGDVASLRLTGEAHCYYNTTGTLGGNTIVSGRASLDFSQDMRAKTVTNPIDVYSAEATIIDQFKAVAGLIVDLNYIAADVNGSQFGSNVRITRGTPA